MTSPQHPDHHLETRLVHEGSQRTPFGETSEARQYSGRATEPEWQCPFHRKQP